MSSSIIVLNGPSSSGKTSIAKELQKILKRTYLILSWDAYVDFIVKCSIDDDLSGGEVYWKDVFQKVSPVFKKMGKLWADQGLGIIIDTVIPSEKENLELISLLGGRKSFFYVGVYCPLGELERREKSRGDRDIGICKSQYERVHKNKTYDLEIDSGTNPPALLAQKILEALK